jgi:excinuclease UvrABC nuclease subunit
MEAKTQILAEGLERFPRSAGVYIMKDEGDVPLYIGKALNLKARVRSYFSDAHADRPHIAVMLRRLHHIDWIATNSEAEALILEANLIRQHKPRFNNRGRTVPAPFNRTQGGKRYCPLFWAVHRRPRHEEARPLCAENI